MAVVVFTDNNLIGNLLTNYDAQADSILELVLKIREYLKTNPIVSSDTVGEIIQEYLDSHPQAGQVTSVNGKTGAVVIGIDDIEDLSGILDACYSSENQPPYPVTSVNGQTGDVVVSGGGAVESVNGKTGAVIIGIDDLAGLAAALADKYSQTNPPPYPVTSVNGRTGAVAIPVPVNSVNGKIGTVVIGQSDIEGLTAALNSKYSASNVPPYPVTSVNGQTGAVNLTNFGSASVQLTFDGENACHLFTPPTGMNTSTPFGLFFSGTSLYLYSSICYFNSINKCGVQIYNTATNQLLQSNLTATLIYMR